MIASGKTISTWKPVGSSARVCRKRTASTATRPIKTALTRMKPVRGNSTAALMAVSTASSRNALGASRAGISSDSTRPMLATAACPRRTRISQALLRTTANTVAGRAKPTSPRSKARTAAGMSATPAIIAITLARIRIYWVRSGASVVRVERIMMAVPPVERCRASPAGWSRAEHPPSPPNRAQPH